MLICLNISRQRLKDKGVRDSAGIKDGDKAAYKFNFWYSESMGNQKAMSAVYNHKPNDELLIEVAKHSNIQVRNIFSKCTQQKSISQK